MSTLVLLFVLVEGCLMGTAMGIPWEKWTQQGKAGIVETLDWIGYYSRLGEQCVFVDKPSQSVRKHLQKHLKAQDRAVESVVAAIESWEFSHKSRKDRTPLVLAVTGPTGTGKTEMANLLAESLFKRKKRLPKSDKKVPTGLLIFRGEDFNDNFTNPITEYHAQIKTRLADHLHYCSGKAVVVFDEVQKVIPHTLDVLMESLSERAKLSYYKNGVTKVIDTSRVIFVFVSDIGVAEMQHEMINYEKRSEIPSAALENSVKSALDAQWKRLNFGKVIDRVIPFLPFEQPHIVEIIKLKLEILDRNYRRVYWDHLWIQDGIPEYMSQLDSIKYEQRSISKGGKIKFVKVYATYGARNVETGPIQLLKSKLLRYLRPFNPDAEVRISQDDSTNEISIAACVLGPTKSQDTQTKRPQTSGDDTDAKWIGVGCTTKWRGSFES